MLDDGTLLQEYAQAGGEEAFGQLVRRHLDLVYSTALRIVNGDAHLAKDVSQSVFIDLARKASTLRNRRALSGWLYTSACFAAAKVVRTERRRQTREQEAHAMQSHTSNDSSEKDWESMRGFVDAVMLELKDQDRQVLLLRFFEHRSLAEVGAMFGLGENAARMRVERALERLRERLARKGVTSTAAVLGTTLATHTVAAAPSGLAAAITASTLTTAAAGGTYSTLTIISMIKAKSMLLGALVIGVAAPIAIQYRTNIRLNGEIEALRAQLAAVSQPETNARPPQQDNSPPDNAELLRLRAEVSALRQRVASISQGSNGSKDQMMAEKQAYEAAQAKALLAKSPEIPMVPAHQWTNAGFATPAEALQTLNWSIANHDTNAFANALVWDAQAKARAEALFAAAPESVRARYGTVDAVIYDWWLNNATPIAAARVLSQVDEGANDAMLVEQHIYNDGRVRENTVQFQRDDNGGWRRVVPPELMPKLGVVLNDLAGGPSPTGK